MNKQTSLRIVFMVAVLLTVSVGSTGAAFKAYIEVNLLWRPDLQLDTVDVNGDGLEDTGDDFRYVDAEIWVTSNVPFFAVDLTCTVSPSVLTGYAWDDGGGTTPQVGDDTQMVVWGDQWGEIDNDFGVIDGTVDSYDPIKGGFHFAATEFGWRHPIGGSGYDETLLMAMMRFQVKPQTLLPGKSVTSPLSCKGNFVDRDGVKVATAKFNKVGNLVVQEGYVIQGMTQLQGQKTHANISVWCDDGVNPVVYTVTDKNGIWKIGGIRNLGTYDCQYYANVLNIDPLVEAAEPWLSAFSWDIPLWNDSYSLLPVELFAGNTDRESNPGDENVNFDDFVAITTTYGVPQLLPYDGGDANGDKKVNETDLTLVGGRYYESEYTWADHLLYDVGTDWDSDWNSHIRYGVVSESSTVLMSEDKYKDYWATMSPDGSTIAFIRYDSKADRYLLYTATYDNGKFKAKVLTPKSFGGDAMAPSWSPDGLQIAFHCSTDVWYNDDDNVERQSNWLYDDGRLCVINANGTSLEYLDGTWNARVYPPTWFNNHVFVFAANQWHWACPDSLCYHDLDRNDTDQVSASFDFTGANAVADMPVLRTDSSGDMHLFYRYIDRSISYGTGPDGNDEITINSRVIRYVDSITYDGWDFALPSGVGSAITFYEEPGGAVFPMADVEYYNVERSWGMHIIGYGHESYDPDDWWYGNDFFVSWFDWGGVDEWDSTWYKSIDRQNGFDTVDKRDWNKCGLNRWDPYSPQCESFGLRNTAELLP